MYKHGLAVMRCQPFHIGHERMVDTMLAKCEMVTIVLGSTNVKDPKNPWAFHDRKKMIKNIYSGIPECWKKMKILGAPDIHDDVRWSKFILEDVVREYYVESLEVANYPEVDAYFAGSQFDSRWFNDGKLHCELINRTNQELPYVSATMVREMGILQDPRWKLYVHKTNHEMVEKYFSWNAWDQKTNKL